MTPKDWKRVEDAAKTIPSALARRYGKPELLEDLQQDFWMLWYDPKTVTADMPIALALWKVKHRLMDNLRSRKYNWSYSNRKLWPKHHFSLEDLVDDAESGTAARGLAIAILGDALQSGAEPVDATFEANTICARAEELLDERSWTALWEHYAMGRTVVDVGRELGLSHSMVSKITLSAIDAIRSKL